VRRLLVAFAQIAASTLAGQIIGFAVLAIVARRIGPSHLGSYAFAFNLVAYIVMPVVGVTTLATREIARDKATAAQVTGATLPTLVAYSLLAAVALWALAPAIAPNPVAEHMLRILCVSIPITLLTTDWALSGLQAFKQLGVARLLGQVAYGATIVMFLGRGLSEAYRYTWLNVLGLGVTFAIVWGLTTHLGGAAVIRRPQLSASLAKLKQGFPLTLSVAMVAIYYSADFVLLGFMSTPAAVGQYTVAYRLPFALLGIAALWNSVIYSHAATLTADALKRQLGMWVTATLVVLIPLCAATIVLAHPILTLAFGGRYGRAGLYFQLLMVSVAFALINGVLAHVLMATGREKSLARGTAMGAAINLILNLALIGSLGPEGSALATIAAELCVFLVLARSILRVIGAPTILWPRVLGSAAASLVTVAVLLASSSAFVLVRIALGAVALTLASALMGVVRASDRQDLFRGGCG
jgi:PST family polysaccharide transporter